MFMLNKAEAEEPMHRMQASADFETSNNFYHTLTNNSQQNQLAHKDVENPILAQLDPGVFEVSAKKVAPTWNTQQYKNDEDRKNLTETSNRGIFTYDAEIADKMRMTNHNLKVSNISEYSNALNRGRVFINPKFSSC